MQPPRPSAIARCSGWPTNAWQRVVAAIVVHDGRVAPTVEAARARDARPDATAAPREVHVVDALPRRGIGKVDRAALVRRFAGASDQ